MTKHERYNHSEKGRARWRRYAQERYDRRKYEGLCVRCGSFYKVSDAHCGDCLLEKSWLR